MNRLKIFWNVVKRCGLDKAVIGFLVLFFAGALLFRIFEPDIHNYGDALWLLFVSCTTIGYGDLTVVTLPGRIFVVVVTVYQMVIFALMTGVVIGHYQEVLRIRKDEIVRNFVDKMEHLTELSPEELREIQEKVKKLK